jgi:hypothetical protein
MSFARGKFGIEYNPVRTDGDSPGLLPWALGVVFLIALISLAATLISRAGKEGGVGTALTSLQAVLDEVEPSQGGEEAAATGDDAKESSSRQGSDAVADEVQSVPDVPPPEKIEASGTAKRPTKVTNLLMRLETAEKNRDSAMAIETIEQLRALPGNPAADLDDSLARRLGALNMNRLFGAAKSPWVAEVVVKRGDTASRIAYEHGSTLASLAKLNGGNVDKVIIGKKLKVMDHPRFSLVVHRLTKTADLSLNAKFFKRYYLRSEVKGDVGAYEVPDRVRTVLTEKGIDFDPGDRSELEMLMPKASTIIIAEL